MRRNVATDYGIRKLEKELAEVKSVKEQPELRSVISEKYNKFGEDA